MFSYGDESMDISGSGFDGKDRELVLGRRTYQIFEAYRPYQPDDHPIAKTFNAAKKYVASRTLTMLHWNNSTLLHGDVVSAIIALKTQPGPDLQIIGSGNLIQTLQAASLIDEYNVWTFPVVLGRGKRLFSETAKPSALRFAWRRLFRGISFAYCCLLRICAAIFCRAFFDDTCGNLIVLNQRAA